MKAAPPDATETLQPNPRVWQIDLRPTILALSSVPMVFGSALAWHDGACFSVLLLLVTLACLLLVLAATKLVNYASDAEHGNDGPGRVGPTRVTGA